ncbi:MAG: baseplate J/gp47 family protein [Mariprofundaceae bacterium]|nr:baseplate J/gp47 family protein [Methylophaga sp.]MBL4759606.1 baseplate J/gp47 family protein [Mariprofundaceae bacterium]
MIFQLTPTGLTIQTYQEIYNELVAGYQAAYGSDINTAPDSPDGQRIGIEAKARLDIQSYALSLYNQLDPDFSTGEGLNKIIKLAGIQRGAPTRSQVDVSITTDRTIQLPIGYTIADDLGQLWETDSITTLLAGTTSTTLFAQNFGNISADAGTVTSPSTIIIGVVSVTNPLAAIAGRDEETDPALRIRRNASLVSPSTTTVGGLYTALGNLEGVTDLKVYENETDVLDVVLSMNAHSIWCVIEGGDIPDIISTIAKNRTAGVSVKGAVTGTFTEILTKPDLSTFSYLHNMKFDRPTYVPIYIALTVQPIGGATIDIVSIKNALAAKSYSISEIARASNLYAAVYGVANNFTATLMSISNDNITFVTDIIASGADEVFTISASNITITEIP